MVNDKKKYKQGQALLIIIMLLATILTVVTAITFKTTSDTQTTKLEEESQKALAAAEGAVEKAIQVGALADFSTLGLNDPGITGRVDVTATATDYFTTPLVQKDEQYTFYLSSPGPDVDQLDFDNLISNYNNKNLTVCFGTGAVELTLIKTDYSLTRYAINPSGTTIIENGTTATAVTPPDASCPSDVTFNNKYTFDVGANNLLLIVRMINASGKIGFYGSSLSQQGRILTSEASTTLGVTKKIRLFQSYPQIPAEFFVPNF